MAERQRFAECPICHHHHAGVAHVWDKSNTPTLAEIRSATAGLERVFPSARSSNGRTAAFEAANVGSSPARASKPPVAKLETARKVLAEAEAKPQKKRGRKPGKVPFDKKAYDREKAKERRDKLKGSTP